MGALSKTHLEWRGGGVGEARIRQSSAPFPGFGRAAPELYRSSPATHTPRGPAKPGCRAAGGRASERALARGGSESRRPGAPSAGLAQPHWARRLRAPPPGSVVIMAAAAFAVPRVKQKAGATRRGSEERG